MAKPVAMGGEAQELRSRAVRAFVFMTRLFEYECRDLDVSLAQYRLLLYLQHGPKRAGELAAQASITRPSLSTLIANLESRGWIRRSEVDDDGRGVSLELSRKGLVPGTARRARVGPATRTARGHPVVQRGGTPRHRSFGLTLRAERGVIF